MKAFEAYIWKNKIMYVRIIRSEKIANLQITKNYMVRKSQIRKLPHLRKVLKTKKISPQTCGFTICGTYFRTAHLCLEATHSIGHATSILLDAKERQGQNK
jgi:hypothetical protein